MTLKTNNIPDWTQADLDAQIALGNFPPGTVLNDIVLPSDWNQIQTEIDATVSNYVPYSGATSNLDLGARNLLANSTSVANYGWSQLDSGGDHYLTIGVNENLSANRLLNIVTGDVSRTLTFAGNATISGTNTGDQNLSGLVPYTGATSDVDLGAFDITATDATFTDNVIIQAAGGSNAVVIGSKTGTNDTDTAQLTVQTRSYVGNRAIKLVDRGNNESFFVTDQGKVSVGLYGTVGSGYTLGVANGAIDINGSTAGFQISDRTTTTKKWQHYSTAGIFRIYNNATGAAPTEPFNIDGTTSRISMGFGVGTIGSAQVNVKNTTEQLRVLYDDSNYYSTTVGSTGIVTLDAVGSAARFYITDPVYAGTTSPPTGVVNAGTSFASMGSNFSFIGGASVTDAARKFTRFAGAHYTNSEEPIMAFILDSISASSAEMNYGGGSSIANTVTAHRWYTAANSTTVTGTERMLMSNGSLLINDLGNDFDVRIEGDNDAQLFVTDGGTDRVGIGVLAPAAKTHIIATTEQQRIGYDASNYYSTTVSSAGAVTFNAVGASSSFIFSDDVSVPDEAYGAGWNGSTEVPTKNAVYDKIQTIISAPTWTEVTGTSQSAAVNSGYIANNAALVTITLPTTAALGDVLEVVGKGAGLWRIAQNASEIIHFGNIDTTTGTGGYLEATNRRDSIRLVCTVADTEWTVTSSQGTITIV